MAETTNKLHKKLVEIQQKLEAPKSQHNSFGNYDYRSCEDILGAVKPLLGECTLTLTDDVTMIGERTYVVATATLSDGKDQISTRAFSREALDKKGMDVSQITGSASSYARKYALNGLLAIDDEKDADTRDNRNTQSTKTENKTTTAEGKKLTPKQKEVVLKVASYNKEVDYGLMPEVTTEVLQDELETKWTQQMVSSYLSKEMSLAEVRETYKA